MSQTTPLAASLGYLWYNDHDQAGLALCPVTVMLETFQVERIAEKGVAAGCSLAGNAGAEDDAHVLDLS